MNVFFKGSKNDPAIMENRIEIPQKTKSRVTTRPSIQSPVYLPPQFENMCLQTLHPYTHRSAIHAIRGGRAVETPTGPFHGGGRGRDAVVCVRSGALLSPERRGDAAVCNYRMDLENPTLSHTGQTGKVEKHMISLLCGT